MSALKPDSVDIAQTEHGNTGHIVVDGEPLCNRNMNATYNKTDSLPSGGICDNCKRIGKMQGLIGR